MEIDERLIETYTLCKRHVLLLENHSESEENLTKAIEHAIENKQDSKLVETLSIFNYVFLFVDLVVRIQKIANSMPRMNNKSSEYRAFNKSLGDLKEIRNRFQHINNEVSTDGTDNLLGTISWYSNSKMYCLSFQDLSRQRGSCSASFEVTEDKKLKINHGISYVLNGNHFDLNAIYNACIKLCEYLDSNITLKDQDGKIDVRDKYDVWSYSISEVDGGVMAHSLTK